MHLFKPKKITPGSEYSASTSQLKHYDFYGQKAVPVSERSRNDALEGPNSQSLGKMFGNYSSLLPYRQNLN